jgi:hypothetical protein
MPIRFLRSTPTTADRAEGMRYKPAQGARNLPGKANPATD